MSLQSLQKSRFNNIERAHVYGNQECLDQERNGVQSLEIKRLNTLRNLGIKFNDIGLLLEASKDKPCLWGCPLSQDNRALSIATLSLIMPDFNKKLLSEAGKESIWSDSIQRFHEDFYETTPIEGGIIPITEVISWVNSLRILILSGREDQILSADL
jgi:hypothetical protein